MPVNSVIVGAHPSTHPVLSLTAHPRRRPRPHQAHPSRRHLRRRHHHDQLPQSHPERAQGLEGGRRPARRRAERRYRLGAGRVQPVRARAHVPQARRGIPRQGRHVRDQGLPLR